MIDIKTTLGGVRIVVENNPYAPIKNGQIIAPFDSLILTLEGDFCRINSVDGSLHILANVKDITINKYKITKNNIVDFFINAVYKNGADTITQEIIFNKK